MYNEIMILRKNYLEQVDTSLKRSPIVALLGPRQCGKTTLARQVTEAATENTTWYDLQSQTDRQRLTNPELMFQKLDGLVVLDEIQLMPELFDALRVSVDRPGNSCRFLILGSASPTIIKGASESLAGRVEFIDLAGFSLNELPGSSQSHLWVRGGFPRSYLADNDADSFAWREGFVRTFLERDIPQLGITISTAAIRRFWTMLAHWNGQLFNASRIAASMGLSDKTIRSYLDLLTDTYMVRQLQPWHANISKRQVKSPKVYFRDVGLLHSLLNLPTEMDLLGHPQCGSSWEAFATEQVLAELRPTQAYFWATYAKAELDLYLPMGRRNIGMEFKLSESPKKTPSMTSAIEALHLDQLLIIHPGQDTWPITETITACPLHRIREVLS